MNKYSEYCQKIFLKETEKEQINNVSLKIVNKSFSKIKGCVKPNLKSSGYEIIINLAPFTKMNEDNKKFYLYSTIAHEIEHIKIFEKVKHNNCYDLKYFISLMEFISYLCDLNQLPSELNNNLIKKYLLNTKININYDISTSEIKSTLEGYKKANDNSGVHKENIELLLKSLEIINKDMIITHDNNGYIVDKEIYYINKASIYLKKNPMLISEYPILKILFHDDGNLKNISELYNSINNDNYSIIDNVIINMLNEDNIIDDKEFKRYIAKLIEEYNNKTIEFYENIELVKIFISKETNIYENLKKLVNKTRYLNTIASKLNIKVRSGLVL